MSTKNNPGKFDCYSRAHPDEPMFVLLGRDPAASFLIDLWVSIRAAMGESGDKLNEAQECSEACRNWALGLNKLPDMLRAHDALFDGVKVLAAEDGIVPSPSPKSQEEKERQ